MAKSLRAKSKQANRRKKRNDEQSHYAAVEASRLQAVSDRLLGKTTSTTSTTNKKAERGDDDDEDSEVVEEIEEADMAEAPKKISTSGPRQNRREAWRESKGMEPRPKNLGQNKQGKPVAKRKAGRNKRRR